MYFLNQTMQNMTPLSHICYNRLLLLLVLRFFRSLFRFLSSYISVVLYLSHTSYSFQRSFNQYCTYFTQLPDYLATAEKNSLN